MSAFFGTNRAHFDAVSDALFGALKAGEELTTNLIAEDSLFVRFNGNRVRQNTSVEQRALSIRLQADGRTVEKQRTITGREATDRAALLALLEAARAEAKALPVDPNQVPMQNNGTSEEEFPGAALPATEAVSAVAQAAEGCDLAGLYAGGPVIRANRNSRGQRHWFATDNFFLDYSLYNGPKASKGSYAGARWDQAAFANNVRRTREQLALLAKPQRVVKPGRYRTYLAPAAFHEIIRIMGWHALSAAAWKQGYSPFQKFAEGKLSLGPLFSLRENFGLGLTPRFNSLGELAPQTVNLVEGGKLRSLLVSSRTAKEFGLASNNASDGEFPRTLEVLPGTLEEKNVLRELGTGMYLSNLHYLNWSDRAEARVTGMTRYACFWVENGEIAAPIQDMRWDESLFDALGSKLIALTREAETSPTTETYFHRNLGGTRSPGALIDNFHFTL